MSAEKMDSREGKTRRDPDFVNAEIALKRAARKARNPRTGDRVDVPSKWVVTFKPGKEMEEKVLQLEAADRALETQSANGPDSGAGDDARHEAEVARLAAADATPRAAVDDSGDDLADAPASAD